MAVAQRPRYTIRRLLQRHLHRRRHRLHRQAPRKSVFRLPRLQCSAHAAASPRRGLQALPANGPRRDDGQGLWHGDKHRRQHRAIAGKLEELSLADDTIVIFLTDNGPQQRRYNGSLARSERLRLRRRHSRALLRALAATLQGRPSRRTTGGAHRRRAHAPCRLRRRNYPTA